MLATPDPLQDLLTTYIAKDYPHRRHLPPSTLLSLTLTPVTPSTLQTCKKALNSLSHSQIPSKTQPQPKPRMLKYQSLLLEVVQPILHWEHMIFEGETEEVQVKIFDQVEAVLEGMRRRGLSEYEVGKVRGMAEEWVGEYLKL